MCSCLPLPNLRLPLLPFCTVSKPRVGLYPNQPLALARMSASTQGKWWDWRMPFWVLNDTMFECYDEGINGHTSPAAATPPTHTPASVQSASSSEVQPPRTPLSIVVTDAVKRWYIDTNKEAVKGDVVCTVSSCPG